MKIIDKTRKWEHGCGCVMKKVANVVTVKSKSKYKKDFEMEEVCWVIDKPCKQHEPNYRKKSDKMLHKREKSEKRNIFLKIMARLKKRK